MFPGDTIFRQYVFSEVQDYFESDQYTYWEPVFDHLFENFQFFRSNRIFINEHRFILIWYSGKKGIISDQK